MRKEEIKDAIFNLIKDMGLEVRTLQDAGYFSAEEGLVVETEDGEIQITIS